ncbi:MAG TPA: fibronectin type III domain-containing protein [Bacteroidota bacterium]|nr:fibronectin type III domain-containing protein [Bacteroidota bacterium]
MKRWTWRLLPALCLLGAVARSQILPPNPPVANAASNITVTSFSANWNSSATATSYILQVATDSIFRIFVPNYNNINVGNVLTYSVTGLNPSTYYYYRVRANNAGGASAVSNFITLATLVPVPSALPATNVSQTSFTANWDTAATASAYLLDVATDTTFTSFVAGYAGLNVGNVITWNVAGLTGATKYFYRVRATNATGTSDNSNIIALLTVPSSPVATAATAIVQTSFSANWNASPGATTYTLEVATDSIFQIPVTGYAGLSVGNVLTRSVTGLSPSTTYYYHVWAGNTSGFSGPSNTIRLTTLVPIPPAPLAAAATNILQASFTANWNPSTGATGYFLDVATDTTFTSILPGYDNLSVGNVTTRSVTGLSGGTKYFYRVRANNGGGTSGSSNIISLTTVVATPAPPVGTAAANVTQTSFAATWTASAGATAYQIDVAADTNFTSMLPGYNNLGVGNVLSQSVPGLSPGTKYFYRVRASNVGGTSASSNVVSVTTVVATPAPPVATAATGISAASFTANWNPSSGATAYFLDVATDTGFTLILSSYGNLNVGNALSRSVTGLTPASKYFYRVRAGNAGGTSGSSNIVSATTPGVPPPAPVLSAPANGAAGVPATLTLAWNPSAGAAGYATQVSLDPSFASPFINDTAVTGLTKALASLALNTTYYWRVAAKNQYGTGAWSSPVFAFSTAASTALSGTVAYPSNPQQSDYRMVSIPGATGGSVADLVAGSGGNQGSDWRAFRVPASGVPAELSLADQVHPGEGVWLIRKNALLVMKSDTLPPLQSGGVYPVPLHAGWNIIGDPFEVPVLWSEISASNDLLTSDVIQGWSGSYGVDTVMVPFRGYYFYNADTTATTLNIPYPLPSTLQRVPPPAPVIDWTLNVGFESADNTDADCRLGVSRAGAPGALEIRKPPLAFAGGEIFFARRAADGTQGKFSTDYRTLTLPVEEWDVQVNRQGGCIGTLRFSGMELIPARFSVVLVSPDDGLPVDLRTRSSYPLHSPARGMTVVVLIGDPAAVAEKVAALVPQSYVLSQNYPNPFNPTTTIRYGLPQKGSVQITVYNALGQEVRRLVNGDQDAGYHEVQFDGTALASGVYFYRIQAGSFSMTKRFVLIR